MKYPYLLFLITLLLTSCRNEVKKNVNNKNDSKIENLKYYLQEQANRDSLHGVVLLGKNDEILLKESYGYVDLDSLHKHTVDSKIGMASMGKMFTAISIFQLESLDKLNLEDLASKYLDDIDNQVIKDSVKIKHLLSHTSGLGSYWDELPDNDERADELTFIYSLVKNDTLLAPVGKEMNYSNSGYIFLGRIIEEITGITYNNCIQQNILNPTQMSSTKIYMPDGGGTTIAEDFWKFAQAIRNGKLIDSKKLQIMTEKQPTGDYGYGFMVKNLNDSKIYGHTGGYWEKGEKIGVASAMDIIDDKYVVIILTNRNPSLGGKKIRDYLLDLLTTKKDSLAP